MEEEFDGRRSLCEGSMRLELPPGSNLEAKLVSGDLTVQGVGGDAQVVSTSGEVRLGGAARDRRAHRQRRRERAGGPRRCAGAHGVRRVSVTSAAAARGWCSRRRQGTWGGPGCAPRAAGWRSYGLRGRGAPVARAKFVRNLHYVSHSGDLGDDLKLSETRVYKNPVGATITQGRLGKGEGTIECSTFSGDLQASPFNLGLARAGHAV